MDQQAIENCLGSVRRKWIEKY